MNKTCTAAFLTVIATTTLANTTETVFTLSDDMRTATKYFSKRGDGTGNFFFHFNKNYNKSLITYARPGNYAWLTSKEDNKPILKLNFPNTASYAFLERLPSTKDILTKDKNDPNRYFLEVDGSTCVGRNCMQDESIISVIIPSRFKVINYGAYVNNEFVAKENGDWKIVDSTYTFYRQNLKGANVQFYLEDAASYGYNKISQSFKQNKEIEVTNEGDRIRIVMPIEKLFASGSSQMQKAGLEWIKTLSESVADFNYLELRVEGHTDNVAIAKRTQQGYTNNWELSSARASNIVQFLIQRGLPSQKLAAVGYADSHHIAPNDTEQGKAKNRRIEFTIVTAENAGKKDAAPVQKPAEQPDAE